MLNMISVKITPFHVPKIVFIEPAECKEEKDWDIPIELLDARVLEELCEEFTKNVFLAAGKIRPMKEKEYKGKERRKSRIEK